MASLFRSFRNVLETTVLKGQTVLPLPDRTTGHLLDDRIQHNSCEWNERGPLNARLFQASEKNNHLSI